MTQQEIDGIFWWPGQPDHKVSGRIIFGGPDAPQLHLIGALQQFTGDAINRNNVRIHGIAKDKYVTLDDCMLTFTSQGITEFSSRERYYVPKFICGALFEEDEPLHFRSIHLKLHYLHQWVNKNRPTFDLIRHNGTRDIKQLELRYTSVDPLIASTDFGQIKLGFPLNFAVHPLAGPSVQPDCVAVMLFDSSRSLDTQMAFCNALQDFVSIGVNRTSSILGVQLTHPDITRGVSGQSTVFEPLDLHAHFRDSDVTRKGDLRRPDDMLFTFEDVGGIVGLSKWLNLSFKFRPAIQYLLGDKYLPRMYVDNRFLNMVIAAESFERIRQNKQRIKLLTALKTLSNMAGASFVELVGDVEAWAKQVIRTRATNVAHLGLHEEERPDYHLLAESLYFLVVLCLLKECGLPEAATSSIQRNRRYQWLAKEMRNCSRSGG